MTLEAIIAWIALGVAIVGLAPAVVGVVTGGISLLHSSEANTIALDANKISTSAAGAAQHANALALDANHIAREANSLARNNEARATELHDVEWEFGYVDEGALFIVNTGLDVAYNVRARIKTAPAKAALMEPTTIVPGRICHVPASPDTALVKQMIARGPVAIRVAWTSAAGTPHAYKTLFEDGRVVASRGVPLG